jgi:hypothetical protein
MARNQFIEWGIQEQHYDDLVVAMQKMRGPESLDQRVFSKEDEFEFYYDLVHAKAGKLMKQFSSPRKNDLALAQTGAALAEGNVEQAAQWFEKIEAGDHLDRIKVANYRAAIAVGKKLLRDKKYEFRDAEGLEVLVGARPLWKYSGDAFVCQLPAHQSTTLRSREKIT